VIPPVKNLLWANYPGEHLEPGYFPVFPDAYKCDNKLSKQTLRLLNEQTSNFYAELIEVFAQEAALSDVATASEYKILLREPLVLSCYLLIDRLIRLGQIFQTHPKDDFFVAKPDDVVLPKSSMELITSSDSSQLFNQYLISKLCDIWSIKAVSVVLPLRDNIRAPDPVDNLTFNPLGFVDRVRQRIIKESLGRFGSLLALSLANIESPLLLAGLFGPKRMAWSKFHSQAIPDAVKDEPLRNAISVSVAKKLYPKLRSLLMSLGLNSKVNFDRAIPIILEAVTSFIPPVRLEGAGLVVECQKKLKTINPRGLMVAGMPNGMEIFLIAAAKNLRIPVIGVQHGAHYGFSEQPCHIELEYAYCDKFITWGSRSLPDHPLCKNIESIPLPSPFLSQRAVKWQRLLSGLSRDHKYVHPYDVLIMSDRLQGFPTTLSTLRLSRVDFLAGITRTLRLLVEKLASEKFKILWKPFDYTSKNIQIDLLNELQSKHKNIFFVHEKLDKGITENLLKAARIIIWDEPGTGFFECLLAGVPSVLLWERHSSTERLDCREIFEKLEEVGILHNSVDSLTTEISSFMKNTDMWMSRAERKSAIKGVLNSICKTSSAWSHQWKVAVSGLAK
jgi:hypothetical protein